ncbi:trypsin-like peptidase domain-containing protein [Candidatus Pacearchaeota archaeon]|nr:trypsin-like peptidase domain-containing protein [Candidatus Pacearchaeota archaeon]
MALRKHHKIIIGGFSSFLIILLIANSVFIYFLYGQLQLSYNRIESDIRELKEDTQSNINTLTENLIQTKTTLEETVNSLDLKIGSMGQEMDLLKASASADFSGIIEDAIKSVVTIRTDISQGTGFIIDQQGYIVTNYHVMENAKSAGIFTYDSETYSVNLIGYNSNFDIALLKISGNFEKLKLADSDDVQIGEKVIAIGNPLGLQFSVSEGIVSAVHRPGPSGINAYIQTDAALNPGNSGGPLINKQGKVIGINNFKIGGGESLGFALESNYIENIVNEIALEKLNQTLI